MVGGAQFLAGWRKAEKPTDALSRRADELIVQNKANFQGRDCRVAAVLAMTGMGEEPAMGPRQMGAGPTMQNKPNSPTEGRAKQSQFPRSASQDPRIWSCETKPITPEKKAETASLRYAMRNKAKLEGDRVFGRDECSVWAVLPHGGACEAKPIRRRACRAKQSQFRGGLPAGSRGPAVPNKANSLDTLLCDTKPNFGGVGIWERADIAYVAAPAHDGARNKANFQGADCLARPISDPGQARRSAPTGCAPACLCGYNRREGF